MPPVKTPGPPTPSRRERSAATRRRIVKAAYELFCERGYAGTTMAMVAERAGVAVQTVYFVFNTKPTLLSRSYDFAVLGEEHPLPPPEQPWYVHMTAEPDVASAVRHFFAGVGEINRRITPLYVVVRAAALSDPEVSEIMDLHERMRRDGYAEVMQVLTGKAPLVRGVTLEKATDLLLLYGGMDVYHFLVGARGWSHEELTSWAAATTAGQLFGAEQAPARRRR